MVRLLFRILRLDINKYYGWFSRLESHLRIRFPRTYNFRLAYFVFIILPEVLVALAFVRSVNWVADQFANFEYLMPLSGLAYLIAYSITFFLATLIFNVAVDLENQLQSHNLFERGSRSDFGSPTIQKGVPIVWLFVLSFLMWTPFQVEAQLQRGGDIEVTVWYFLVWIILYISIFLALALKTSYVADLRASRLYSSNLGWLGSSTISGVVCVIALYVLLFLLGFVRIQDPMFVPFVTFVSFFVILVFFWQKWLREIAIPGRLQKSTPTTRLAWIRALNGLPITGTFIAVFVLEFSGFHISDCVNNAIQKAIALEKEPRYLGEAIVCAVDDSYWGYVPYFAIAFTLAFSVPLVRQGRYITSLPREI